MITDQLSHNILEATRRRNQLYSPRRHRCGVSECKQKLLRWCCCRLWARCRRGIHERNRFWHSRGNWSRRDWLKCPFGIEEVAMVSCWNFSFIKRVTSNVPFTASTNLPKRHATHSWQLENPQYVPRPPLTLTLYLKTIHKSITSKL